MAEYNIVHVGGYTILSAPATTAERERLFPIVQFIDVGGTVLPRTGCFYVDRTPSVREFLRGASIFADTGGTGVVANNHEYMNAYWDFRKLAGNEVPIDPDVATSANSGIVKPDLLIFLLNDDPAVDRWEWLPPGTIMMPGGTYRIVWRYPLPSYQSAAEFGQLNADGFLHIQDMSNIVAVEDTPQLKKKVV